MNLDNSGRITTFDNGNLLYIDGTLINEISGRFLLHGFSNYFIIQGDVYNDGLITNGGFGDVLNTGGTPTDGQSVLNIIGTLNNTGSFIWGGFDNSVMIGSIVNYGILRLFPGGTSQLQVNGYVQNAGEIYLGLPNIVIGGGVNNSGQIYISGGGVFNRGVLNIGGTLSNAGSSFLGDYEDVTIGSILNNYGGEIDLGSVSTLNVYGGVGNAGHITVGNGSYVAIGGEVNNSGQIDTYGGDFLNIGGTLNNTGSFLLNGGSDSATIGSVVNSGIIDLEGASTLEIYGDASNSGSISLGNSSGGNGLTVDGMLTN